MPMPRERDSITHSFEIQGSETIHVTIGLIDGKPAEIFIKTNRTGSTERGLLNCVAILASMAMQHGVEWEVVARKLAGMRFEPSGFTDNENIRTALSPADYIGKWMLARFRQVDADNEMFAASE